jgi:hypothetical protein
MKNLTKYKYRLGGLALLFSASVCAQDMTSPYTVYGIGNIEHREFNRTGGMGYTGLALPADAWVISHNPASIAGMQKGFYNFDLQLAGKSVKYIGDPIDASARPGRDFGVRRASFAVKITNNWASSAGFSQYSTINYKYLGNLSVEGSAEKFPVQYEGDGGLNSFYWTNAISIKKNLLLGLRINVISGSINRAEFMTGGNEDHLIETRVQDFYSNARLEYGLLYTIPLNLQWTLSAGGRFAAKMDISPERTVTVKENDNIMIDEALIETDPFKLPLSFGAGIAIRKNNMFTIAADYSEEKWEPLNIKGSGWSMVNSQRLSGGVEIGRKVERWDRRTTYQFFQFGGFFNNSYLSVRSNPIREFGATFGFASNYRNVLYNIGLEIGQRGTTRHGLIKENYFQFTIGLSYRDFFLTKARKYD